jgi:hypothetical protein
MLAEIFVEPVGLTEEEWDMSFGSLQETSQGDRRLFEFGRELVMFMVAPSLPKVLKLAVNGTHLLGHILLELLELHGKSTNFGWVGMGLRHGNQLHFGRGPNLQMNGSFAVDQKRVYTPS